MKTTLDIWDETCHKLFPSLSSKKENALHPIHSCIIDGKPCYVHAPNLEKDDPGYYKKLASFAAKNGIRLKADQRSANETRPNCRRRKLLPILFLTFGVSSELAFAEDNHQVNSTLGLIRHDIHNHENVLSIGGSDSNKADQHLKNAYPNKVISAKIERILLEHFAPTANTPKSILDDIEQLADYYSSHPEATKLIESLDKLDWKLSYAPHTFQTNIQGSRLQIHDVTVYFDPRSGAKLKFYDKCSSKTPFCVASPADALLHELLHAQTALLDTNTFIAQGGLNGHSYPIEHERHTILKENVLYKSMSRRDHKPRPIRSEHTGRHVLVSCVTCVD